MTVVAKDIDETLAVLHAEQERLYKEEGIAIISVVSNGPVTNFCAMLDNDNVTLFQLFTSMMYHAIESKGSIPSPSEYQEMAIECAMLFAKHKAEHGDTGPIEDLKKQMLDHAASLIDSLDDDDEAN